MSITNNTTAKVGEEYFTTGGEIACVTDIDLQSRRIHGVLDDYIPHDWDYSGKFYGKDMPSPLDLVLPKSDKNTGVNGFYNKQKATELLIEVDLTI